MLILYEFEACPYCKIAREAVSEAGISLLVRPCPKEGLRFRPRVGELGGKIQFPYLFDPDTGEGMYESGDVAAKMRQEFSAPRPFVHALGRLNRILAQVSIMVRLRAGNRAVAATPNEKPLEFFGTEVNPAGRLVKEALCAAELEYIWHTGQGDSVRLIDPNKGVHLHGARSILAHLREAYRAGQ